MLTFQANKMLAVGEAMIEMSLVDKDTYRRSFAGDTYNTAWHISQVPNLSIPVGFVSRVGSDAISDEFVAQCEQDGLDRAFLGRDPVRTMGLYVIDLNGVERSFQYWREQSAARLLANDAAWLDRVLSGAGLIHLSGITLAILSAGARDTFYRALVRARGTGARLSFDPNVRPRLWKSVDEIRTAMKQFYAIADIALPSFDDESDLWGDRDPADTIQRLCAEGVPEIVVKNGEAPITVWSYAEDMVVPTPFVEGVIDTTGAGDAFNAGYLAARLAGLDPVRAVSSGQMMSAEVIRHYGARIPKGQVPGIAV